MMNIQVLVAAMHQKDTSLAEKMNIRCSAIIANQADREEISRTSANFGEIKMITTETRGVGLNRNIALMAASADVLLFSDDDVVYNDDMPKRVAAAFDEIPTADVIIFGMDIVKNCEVTEKRHLKTGRLHVWNSMRFGTYTVAVRRSSIVKKNITFNQCFGGGCVFSAGEDSLFIKSCFDAGLRVYSYDYVLGTCAKDSSTWFVGHNEKYFYDKGVLVRNLFPRTAYLMALYFGIRFKRKTDLGVMQRLKYIYSGVRCGKRMIPYGEGK